MTDNKSETRNEYITRDNILKLLSNEEVAEVSSSETETRLADGDEFLDLGKLELGVQRAPVVETPMGRVLSKEAVSGATWLKIIELLAKAHMDPHQKQ